MQVRIKATLGIAAVLGVAVVMTVGFLTPAQASASALLPVTSFAGTAVPVHLPIARSALLWPGAPDGCPAGAVCFYRQGNGGNLCEPFFDSTPNLGECANIGPSGTIFNNGNNCSGCQDVLLFYSFDYGAASYCLHKGDYLMHIEQDYFDRTTAGSDGLGQTLAYRPGQSGGPGGVVSMKWTSC